MLLSKIIIGLAILIIIFITLYISFSHKYEYPGLHPQDISCFDPHWIKEKNETYQDREQEEEREQEQDLEQEQDQKQEEEIKIKITTELKARSKFVIEIPGTFDRHFIWRSDIKFTKDYSDQMELEWEARSYFSKMYPEDLSELIEFPRQYEFKTFVLVPMILCCFESFRDISFAVIFTSTTDPTKTKNTIIQYGKNHENELFFSYPFSLNEDKNEDKNETKNENASVLKINRLLINSGITYRLDITSTPEKVKNNNYNNNQVSLRIKTILTKS